MNLIEFDWEHYTPRAGDLFVCRIPGQVRPLIRIGQWLNGDSFSDHEHAGVYLGGGLVAEAHSTGARIRRLDAPGYRGYVWSYPRFDPPGETRLRVAARARWYVDRPGGTLYSAEDYFALAGHRLHVPDLPCWPEDVKDAAGRVTGRRLVTLRAFIDNSGHMICSQFDDRVAADVGWHLFADGRWPGYVSPGMLWGLFTGRIDGGHGPAVARG